MQSAEKCHPQLVALSSERWYGYQGAKPYKMGLFNQR